MLHERLPEAVDALGASDSAFRLLASLEFPCELILLCEQRFLLDSLRTLRADIPVRRLAEANKEPKHGLGLL